MAVIDKTDLFAAKQVQRKQRETGRALADVSARQSVVAEDLRKVGGSLERVAFTLSKAAATLAATDAVLYDAKVKAERQAARNREMMRLIEEAENTISK